MCSMQKATAAQRDGVKILSSRRRASFLISMRSGRVLTFGWELFRFILRKFDNNEGDVLKMYEQLISILFECDSEGYIAIVCSNLMCQADVCRSLNNSHILESMTLAHLHTNVV